MMTRLAVLAALALIASPVLAADDVHETTLVIKDHKFQPATLDVPANKKIKITVDNQDSTPEEFESHELNREKVIQGKTTGVVLVGPLKPGEYVFFGEFHQETAKGKIVAK